MDKWQGFLKKKTTKASKQTNQPPFYFSLLFIICMGVLQAWWPEEGIGLHGTGITDSCEPLCGCWELNLDLLQGQ